jgi:preprotein translocase subunit SecE
MRKMLRYVKNVRLEWFKIVWPNRDTVVRSTVLIIIFSAIFAAFLFLVDSVMSAVVGWIF